MSGLHILVVDDDDRIRALLCDYLRRCGADTDSASDTREAEAYLKVYVFDLIVLDRMMPGRDGEAFLRDLRAREDRTPVIMLTARGEAEDRISGLEAGADDYVPKPFDPKELWLRAKNLTERRSSPSAASDAEEFMRLGACRLHKQAGHLTGSDGAQVPLSERERAVLLLLAESEGEPVAREALADAFAVNERSADVMIARLRKTLRAAGAENCLRSVRNVGYVLVP